MITHAETAWLCRTTQSGRGYSTSILGSVMKVSRFASIDAGIDANGRRMRQWLFSQWPGMVHGPIVLHTGVSQ